MYTELLRAFHPAPPMSVPCVTEFSITTKKLTLVQSMEHMLDSLMCICEQLCVILSRVGSLTTTAMEVLNYSITAKLCAVNHL